MVLKFGEISHNLVEVRPLPARGRRARSGFARRTPDEQTPRFGPGGRSIRRCGHYPAARRPRRSCAAGFRARDGGWQADRGRGGRRCNEKDAMAIPTGSAVRGRVRGTECYSDPSVSPFVGLEFTEVKAIPHLFYVDVATVDPAAGVTLTLPSASITWTATIQDSRCHFPTMWAGSRLFSSQMLSMRSVSGCRSQPSLTVHGFV